jgi:hypothetical protein
MGHRPSTASGARALLALACVLVAVGVPGPSGVHAKDKLHEDAAGIYSIELPKRWKVSQRAAEPPTLGLYDGWFEIPVDEPDLVLAVREARAFSRAKLAHHVLHRMYGSPVPDTAHSDDTSASSCRMIDPSRTAVWRRFVAQDGVVVYAECGHAEDWLERHGKRIDRVLGTLVVKRAPPPPVSPDGFVLSKAPPFQVWSSAKKKDKAVQRALDAALEGWEQMRALLPGDAYTQRERLVVLHGDDAAYRAAAGGGVSDFSATDLIDGRLHVRLGGVKGRAYQPKLREQGARQYVRAYFGGPCPRWLEDGLAFHAAVAAGSKGDPAKPRRQQISKARPLIAADERTWAEHLRAVWTAEDDSEATLHVLWGWHWYFRHGPGRDAHGKRYDDALAKVRDTGDPALAEAAWRGVDQAALLADFKKWAKRW